MFILHSDGVGVHEAQTQSGMTEYTTIIHWYNRSMTKTVHYGLFYCEFRFSIIYCLSYVHC